MKSLVKTNYSDLSDVAEPEFTGHAESFGLFPWFSNLPMSQDIVAEYMSTKTTTKNWYRLQVQ